MTVYIDIIFLENLFMNCIILFATAVILKLPIKIVRILISGIIGSIYAVIIYTSKLQIYSNLFLKIALSAVMVYVAFNPSKIRGFLKNLMIFYLVSFTFGGVTFALLYFVKPQNISFQNGVLIGVSPIKIIITGGIIGFVIITISFKNIKGRLTKKDMICNLEIIQKDKKVKVKAIIDTGNFLTDPITKMPVVVVEKEKLIDIFPKSVLENTMDFVNGANTEMEEYLSKIRIIPFKSLGKENGLLLGIKVDGVIINYQGNDNFIKEVIVGIYEKKLSSNNSYSALIGLNILEKGEDYDEHFRHVKN
jgi:stage II sporulation protein GA (sporulation sigma-E factor processing peptidase)